MTKQQDKSPGHSALGPSSSERWFACPGSINLIASLPAEAFRQNKYAAEGSVAHKIAEDMLTGTVDFLAMTMRVGEVVMQDGFEVEIIEDMINGAVEYADAIAEARKELTKPIAVVDETEVRVHASSIDERVWGTADKVLFQKGFVLHVFDYKFGKHAVEVAQNKQMMTYAVAVEDTLAGAVFDKIVLHIIQPRGRHSEGTHRQYVVTPEELLAFRAELKAAVERTKDPGAKRVPGPVQCKFCPALAYCAEARGEVEAAAQTTFTVLPGPPSKEVGVAEFLPPAGAFTPEQLARALEWEDSIDSWFEALRLRGIAELQRDPNSLPGWKLVEKKTNRAWRDEAEVEAAFAIHGEERYAPRKLRSPKQMEAVAGKKEVEKYAVKPQGAPTIAKASDKRPALTAQGRAEEVFAALPEPVKAQAALDADILGTSVVQVPESGDPTNVTEEALFGDLVEKKEPIWPV